MSDNKEIRYILLATLGSIALGVFALLSIFPNLLSGGGFLKESALDMALLSFLGIVFVFLARHRRLSLWIFNTSFTVFIFGAILTLKRCSRYSIDNSRGGVCGISLGESCWG